MINNVHAIYGAPGCGKTTRLMHVLMEELRTVDPTRIAYVSFTRKGVYEGVERAKTLYNLTRDNLPYFRTLHSIAFRAGNYSRYDMISKSDYRSFSNAMGMSFTGYYTEEFHNSDDKYLFMHFLKRNNPAMAETFALDLNARMMCDVESNYIRFKQFANVHDFTDIIERFVFAGEALPLDVAIIDEAQDLTTLQWKMCEVAFANCQRVYIAGDDDQAIYEWSGADVNYFLSLKPTTAEVLAKSYRLQRNILDLSKGVTRQITRRINKQFEPVSDAGNIIHCNSLSDITLNDAESWYFLSRNNYYLSRARAFLREHGKVYIDKDVISFDQRQLNAIRVFEACRKKGSVNDVDDVKLKLYLKGKADLSKPWYDSLNFDNDTIIYYKDLFKACANFDARNYTVNTIHGVKGGEADNVVLLLDYTQAIRGSVERCPDAELRCLYVGITRAKRNLYLVHSSTKNGYDNFIRSAYD